MKSVQDPATAVCSPAQPGGGEVRGGVSKPRSRGQHILDEQLAAQQREFFHEVPFVVTSHCDEYGQPWAGLITGEPGFLWIDGASKQVALNWRRASNPTRIDLMPGAALGMLGIDFTTRRRSRLDGTLAKREEQQWRLRIDQGYGHCPRYIQKRPWPINLFAGSYRLYEDSALSARTRRIIDDADTFFIATCSGPSLEDKSSWNTGWGTDIAHHSGETGLIGLSGNRLLIEGYSGDELAATLDNAHQYPYCGLLFIDFDSGDLLQLAGIAMVEQRAEGRTLAIDLLKTRHWRKPH